MGVKKVVALLINGGQTKILFRKACGAWKLAPKSNQADYWENDLPIMTIGLATHLMHHHLGCFIIKPKYDTNAYHVALYIFAFVLVFQLKVQFVVFSFISILLFELLNFQVFKYLTL